MQSVWRLYDNKGRTLLKNEKKKKLVMFQDHNWSFFSFFLFLVTFLFMIFKMCDCLTPFVAAKEQKKAESRKWSPQKWCTKQVCAAVTRTMSSLLLYYRFKIELNHPICWSSEQWFSFPFVRPRKLKMVSLIVQVPVWKYIWKVSRSASIKIAFWICRFFLNR